MVKYAQSIIENEGNPLHSKNKSMPREITESKSKYEPLTHKSRKLYYGCRSALRRSREQCFAEQKTSQLAKGCSLLLSLE